MPASIGVNLRVTGHCRQGGRKYMEDFFSVAYQQTEDEKDLEYAFFGIYDGHGGAEAAAFAKEHLMDAIVKHRCFWSDDDEEVLRSIKEGFIHTHLAMWKIHDKWPKTGSGLPSTAGTTASVAFIRRGKIYIGHVGDSGITLGYQEPGSTEWRAKPLTIDHKPECKVEMMRIEQCGGKVVAKSGVPRVVWNRPRIGHKGPVRRSTPIDEIPFLAVARSLGDLWSYNSALDQFVVSPSPDVAVIPINTNSFRCLIFGTDGLYNMLSSQMAVHIVQQAEKHNEQAALSDSPTKIWINPSKCLVEKALERWSITTMRADNTSVITLMLDPPGPPRAQVLRNKKNLYSSSGLQIETRYHEKEENKSPELEKSNFDKVYQTPPEQITSNEPTDISKINNIINDIDNKFVPKLRESMSFNPSLSEVKEPTKIKEPEPEESPKKESDIQINEISSSSIDSCDEENQVKLSKKSPKNENTGRKINLRSSGQKSSEKEEITSSKCIKKTSDEKSTNVSEKKVALSTENKPASSNENFPETSRKDLRVLRERRNTPNEKNPIIKKKLLLKKKLVISTEKKKILQAVIFKNKDIPTTRLSTRNKSWVQKDAKELPSISGCTTVTKENSRVLRNSNRIPPKVEQKRKSQTPKASDSKVERKIIVVKTKPEKGLLKKSSLVQRLRMHQETFKAKLRTRSQSSKKLEKGVKIKKTVVKRS